MLCLQIFLFTLSVYFISANGYCSKSKSKVSCQPCSVICPDKETCAFRCPKQCGPNTPHQCHSVCSWKCRHSACEFDDDASLKCSEGCLDGFTGKYCQEQCSKGCSVCQQFGTGCVECEKGLKGKDCSIKEEKNVTIYTTRDYEEHDRTVDNVPCQKPACGTTTFWPTTQSSVNHEATAAAVLPGTVDLLVIPLVIGISVVLILIAIVILVYVKLRQKHGKSLHGQREPNLEDICLDHQEGTRVVMSNEYEDPLPQSL